MLADVVSLGYIGQVKQVKILGGLAVNDVSEETDHWDALRGQLIKKGDETDWKILAIDIKDPLAPYVNGQSRTSNVPRCCSHS